ncbi:MAG TPA: MBOAT family O-acyltransferase [Candidatus Atribacteria bacterium]|nr:MBOAT family O-acyltransferase [Candidatus Atribacteria bacterium]
MLFSSITFLYYFLPAVLVLYYLVPSSMKNTVLLAASLFFYFYGEPAYSILMIMASLSGYLHGLWIEKARNGRFAKVPLVSSIILGLGPLVYFKYTDFLISNVNTVFGSNLTPLRLALPIGISFYTFQIMSYTIDVYRGKAGVQRNFFDFATYVSLFPQLIAGPIVRYTTIEAELENRTHSLDDFAYGVNRFIIGLSKKVLLANTLGELGKVFSSIDDKTLLLYWTYAVAFTLQIYFDFSGYSDMAIGMGRMLGFRFLENFNYPLISGSITEFWRRWHMSLGTWFRDYVYIPMGGNRISRLKWLRNITVVWLLTGLWHGAEWNFVIWGLYFALFLALEKLFLKKLLDRIPSVFRHLYTLFFILISFVIFNADGMAECIMNLKGMFGMLGVPLTSSATTYYLRSYALTLVVAAIAATPVVTDLLNKLSQKSRGAAIINALEPVVLGLLLLVVTGYLVDGSFNPFLYFRF